MASISQPEGSSQPTKEQNAGIPFQVKEQPRDSSNWNQEQPVTTSTPTKEHSICSSSSGNDPFTRTSLLKPQESTFTTIATELRLKIYKYLFQTPTTHLLRRRAGIDDEKVIEKLANTFDNSITFTCRKLYQEALPSFYASQTFHHSSTTGGLSKIDSQGCDAPVREGAMPLFSNKLHLMVNLSMDMEVIDSGHTDAVLSQQITEFAQHCPKLRALTIHLLISNRRNQGFQADSATVSVLRQLRPRLANLSILVLGSRPHEVLSELRRSIADNKRWSGKFWSGERHSGFNARTFQWPYLTIPSLIFRHVGRECFQSSNFAFPPPTDKYIYKWTFQKEVEDDVGLDSLPLSSSVGAREAALDKE